MKPSDHKALFLHGLLCALLLCWSGWALAQSTKQAPSGINAPGNAVKLSRDQTRQQIENVQADQPGPWDNATTLGRTLPARSLSTQGMSVRQAKPVDPSLVQNNPGQDQPTWSTPAPLVLNQWPAFVNPDQAVGRVPFRKRGLTNQDGSLVYTPDFSRQLMTFALLVNTPYVDLPFNDNDPNSTMLNFRKDQVDPQKAATLPYMVKLGLANSPVLDQTLAQIELAVSRTKAARSEFFPKFSARYQKGRETSEPQNQPTNTHTTESSAFRLVQPLINVPVVRDWMAELSNEQATVWRSYAANESVALAVTQAVISVTSARLMVEFSDEQLNEFNQLFVYVQNRAQSGAASAADVERLRARLMQARQNRIEQQASYMSAMLELERLIGVKPSSLQLPYLNQLPGLPATREQIRQTVWDSSQDLQILRKDVQSQAHVVASIYSRLLPTLSFNLEHDIGQNVRGTNPKQTDTRALGVMSWEMALGGKDLYAAHMAQAELAQRQSKLTEEADRLMQSVDADFALLQSTTLRIATGQAEQDAALMVLQSLQQQMKTGRVGSLLEALDANERYFGARMRLMQTLAQQMQAQAQLLRRLGVLSQLQSMVNQPVDINASMTRLKPPPEAVPSQLVKPETPSPSPSPTDLAPDATKDGVQVPAVPEPSAVSSQPIGALEPVQAPLQPLPAPNN